MTMQRTPRSRSQDPRSVPWEVDSEIDVVAVDTTWGELQPLEIAPGVQTVGELELLDLLDSGALLVDSRTSGSLGGRTIPGAVSVPHDETVARQSELTRIGRNVLFCNGPQCPQSPDALRQLLADGFPAQALAYYRGGMHDWVTLAFPTASL